MSVFPSYSGRWACPGCASYKLGRKLERVVLEVENVAVGWVEDTCAVRWQSRQLGVGFLSIRCENTTKLLVMADAKIGRSFDSVDMEIDTALEWLRGQLMGRVVKRFNLSNHWQPEATGNDDIIISAHKSKSYEEVRQGIAEAGYPEMRWTGDRRDVVRRIKDEVGGFYDPELGMFNTS